MTKQIYQLKIQLAGKPPIWRTIQIPENTTFYKLHGIIQTLMCWEDDHLFEFKISPGVSIGGDPDGGGIDGCKSPKRSKVKEYLQKSKQKIKYIYDFGASWECSVILENILEEDPKQKYPVCIDGNGDVPPEYEDEEDEEDDDDYGNEEEDGDDDDRTFDIKKINKRLGHKP